MIPVFRYNLVLRALLGNDSGTPDLGYLSGQSDFQSPVFDRSCVGVLQFYVGTETGSPIGCDLVGDVGVHGVTASRAGACLFVLVGPVDRKLAGVDTVASRSGVEADLERLPRFDGAVVRLRNEFLVLLISIQEFGVPDTADSSGQTELYLPVRNGLTGGVSELNLSGKAGAPIAFLNKGDLLGLAHARRNLRAGRGGWVGSWLFGGSKNRVLSGCGATAGQHESHKQRQ